MRTFGLAIIIALSLFTSAVGQTARPDPRSIYMEGLTAYNEGDMQGFLDAMLELETLRPHQWSILYNVAAGYALTGETDRAIEKLETIAASGLYIDIAEDSDFASLADHPLYDALIAAMAALIGPQGESALVHEFNLAGVMAEGLAVDEANDTVYVSSVRQGLIWRTTDGSALEEFVAPDAHDGIGGLFGMAVDAERGLLWATSSTPGQYIGPNRESQPPSALYAFDLITGVVEHYFPLEGEGHFLGEVLIGPDGGVYASDSADPVIYRVRDDFNALEPFFAGDQYTNFQGFDFDGMGRLYIADYVHGLVVVDLPSGQAQVIAVADGSNLSGVDGLFYWDGSLVAIRNGTPPHSIIRFILSEDGQTILSRQTLAVNLDTWDEPTLGQIVDSQLFYNAASGWPSFMDDGSVADGADLSPIRIMSISLD